MNIPTKRLFPEALRTARGGAWLQAAGLLGFWALSDALIRWSGLPLPGSVAGLLILWFALDAKLLPLAWVERGADRLLDHLMLFFVPAMLALVNHPELLSWLGVKLLFVVLAGTIAVMAGTALISMAPAVAAPTAALVKDDLVSMAMVRSP